MAAVTVSLSIMILEPKQVEVCTLAGSGGGDASFVMSEVFQ